MTKDKMPSYSLLRETGIIILISVFLALVYNAFSSRRIALIREDVPKVAIADSLLFIPKKDTVTDVKVIAPLHQRALQNPDSMAKLYPKAEETSFKVITLEQLKRLLGEQRGILLDARNPDEYMKGHIKGARNIPALDVEKYFDKIVTIPRDTIVIIYCNNPECHMGAVLANFLKVMEFKSLLLYDGGWDSWTEAKMPVDTSIID